MHSMRISLVSACVSRILGAIQWHYRICLNYNNSTGTKLSAVLLRIAEVMQRGVSFYLPVWTAVQKEPQACCFDQLNWLS